jgi:hypothetical protein
VTHYRLWGVLLVESLEGGFGDSEALPRYPLGLGQLLPSLLDVLELVISHGPTIGPYRAPKPGTGVDTRRRRGKVPRRCCGGAQVLLPGA